MKKALIVNPNTGKSALISTIGDTECVGFYKMLELAGVEPYYLQQNKFTEINTLTLDEIDDINKFDYVFLYNYNANFFGGADNPFIINCVKMLAMYKKDIYYLLVDMGIFFKQLGAGILSRPWESVKGLIEKDITIGNLIYISQGYDLNLINVLKQGKGVISKSTKYYPLQVMALFNKNIKFEDYNSDREYDLYYGGSFRSGRRETQFIDYFFNKDIKSALFGSISEKDFKGFNGKYPTFNGKVKQDLIIEENRKGLATIILSEKNYNNNMITLRLYESILADMVVFIDNKFDTKHIIFNDPVLKDFNYVKNGKELQDKILKLKSDKEFLYNIIIKQREEFNTRLFVKDKLITQLKDLIGVNDD